MITGFVTYLPLDTKTVLWKADRPTEILLRGRSSSTYIGDDSIDSVTGFKLISQSPVTVRLNDGDVLFGLCKDTDSELYMFVSAFKA